jgi:hypothetical protein
MILDDDYGLIMKLRGTMQESPFQDRRTLLIFFLFPFDRGAGFL